MKLNVQNNLSIQDLHVHLSDQEILSGVSLEIPCGKVSVLMGPNGSGKSTLAHVLMGNPIYQVTKGHVTWQKKNLFKLKIHERAKAGLFLGFQIPAEIAGLRLYEFLLTAFRAVSGKKNSQAEFEQRLKRAQKLLRLSDLFLERFVNAGFSGGEKKKAEMLQMLILEPNMIILDEIDSGLDVDALKTIIQVIHAMRSAKRGFLIITHYQRFLKQLCPDYVYVMLSGRVVKSGGTSLALKIEKKGYEYLREGAREQKENKN